MILGMVGKARSGKDTFNMYLLDALCDIYGKEFKEFAVIAFAQELKSMCMKHFGLLYDQVYGNSKEVVDKRYKKPNGDYWTAREIMQAFGEFYRTIDYDYWVNLVGEMIDANPDANYVITDVRHRNESDFVKNKGGILIKIVRKDLIEIHGMDHISEIALDDMPDNYFDITINNDGSLEDLQVAAYQTAKFILKIEKLKSEGEIYNG